MDVVIIAQRKGREGHGFIYWIIQSAEKELYMTENGSFTSKVQAAMFFERADHAEIVADRKGFNVLEIIS